MDFVMTFQLARDLHSTPSFKFTACPFNFNGHLLLEESAFMKIKYSFCKFFFATLFQMASGDGTFRGIQQVCKVSKNSVFAYNWEYLGLK